MSRRACYHIDSRFVVSPETVATVRAACTASGRYTWPDRSTRLRVHTLRGVPGAKIDILLPERDPADGVTACEIGRKLGCFDGAVRWRLTFRPWPRQWDQSSGKPPSLSWPGPGSVSIEEDCAAAELAVVCRWRPAGIWAQAFPQLRHTVEPGPRRHILFHHWKSYFHFLPAEEVDQTAALWEVLPAVQQATDIVALNRMASTMLYDLATSLGWRKLTLRDKRRLGLSQGAPQWHRTDGLILRQAISRDGTHTGCGAHTLAAAAGEAIRLPAGVCPHCHELVATCRCG